MTGVTFAVDFSFLIIKDITQHISINLNFAHLICEKFEFFVCFDSKIE